MNKYLSHINLANTMVPMTAFAVIAWLISGYKDALAGERRLARSDALTGLLNSRGLNERASVEIARSQRSGGKLVLALIDLDHLKQVNDTLGHAAGDTILSDVGDIIQRRLRRTDIAARLGGDEFAILMPDTDGAGAGVVLESIRESVAAMAATRSWPLTTSIGVCAFPKVPTDVDAMLREADKLMYDAKRAGRNRITSRVVDCTSAARAAAEA